MIDKNTVRASGQVAKERYVEAFENGGSIRVLFVGNSITRHEPKPEIGWNNDWGMAASSKDKDYVHVAVKMLEDAYGKIDYCITNCGEWEINYFQSGLICEWQRARDFNADIIFVRIGENVWNAKDKLDQFAFAPRLAEMIRYFAVRQNVKVVLSGLFWDMPEIEQSIKQVAFENGFDFVELKDLGEDSRYMAIGQYWHSGVSIHPNDLGMLKIAERMVSSLRLSTQNNKGQI